MKVKRSLTLQTAAAIVDRALEVGRESSMSPLVVLVLDSGGVPISFKSEDGCGIMRYNVAMGKAYGALGMGASSRSIGNRLELRPTFANSLAAASQGKFIPVPGGVLIVDEDGYAVGSVGISGDTSAKDEYCAVKAIHEAGFQSEPPTFDPDWAD